jgi:hypothetical protein
LSRLSVRQSRGYHEALLGAISAGFFFVLIGALFISNPNFFSNVVTFLSNWQTVHLRSTNISIPVPEHLGDNIALDVYLAARNFSLVWGIFLGVMLGSRFILDSPTRRKVQNVGGIVFWLGAAFVIQILLVEKTQAMTINVSAWLAFWAAVIMLIGVSLIVRAIFLVAARAVRSI